MAQHLPRHANAFSPCPMFSLPAPQHASGRWYGSLPQDPRHQQQQQQPLLLALAPVLEVVILLLLLVVEAEVLLVPVARLGAMGAQRL